MVGQLKIANTETYHNDSFKATLSEVIEKLFLCKS